MAALSSTGPELHLAEASCEFWQIFDRFAIEAEMHDYRDYIYSSFLDV